MLPAAGSAGRLPSWDAIQPWLQAGGDPNTIDERGRTLLMLAVSQQNLRAIECLLQYGADCNRQQRQGATALALAAMLGAVEVVRVLLAAGASTKIPDAKNMVALDCAYNIMCIKPRVAHSSPHFSQPATRSISVLADATVKISLKTGDEQLKYHEICAVIKQHDEMLKQQMGGKEPKPPKPPKPAAAKPPAKQQPPKSLQPVNPHPAMLHASNAYPAMVGLGLHAMAPPGLPAMRPPGAAVDSALPAAPDIRTAPSAGGTLHSTLVAPSEMEMSSVEVKDALSQLFALDERLSHSLDNLSVIPGGRQGSRQGSHQGSRQGSHQGSHQGSRQGSNQGSRMGSSSLDWSLLLGDESLSSLVQSEEATLGREGRGEGTGRPLRSPHGSPHGSPSMAEDRARSWHLPSLD